MTKNPIDGIDKMPPEELRRHIRWLVQENERLNDFITTYRSTVLDAVDTIRNAS